MAKKVEIIELIKPELENQGIALVDLEFSGTPKRKLLRLYIDRLGETEARCTLTVSDCERVSRSIERLLDVEDLIGEPYTLEVSTPGIERPLTKLEDYIRFKGLLSRVTISENGKDFYFEGRISGVEGEQINFEINNKTKLVNLVDIKRAKLKFER